MNLDSFLLNKKQVSEQVEQIEVMRFPSEDFWLNTYMWTLDRKKTPENSQDLSKIWAETPCRSNLATRRKMITFSYDHEITQLYCFRSSMKWRHKKWNVNIILPVIHETSNLAKNMYIQDGNLSVVQSISHIPDYEPSIRKTHNTMEGSGVLQKKMLGLQLRARSNLGKEHPFSKCHKLQYSHTCTDPPYPAPGAL
jgi:hypothetical protein